MKDALIKLRKIVAKTYREAKSWYLRYVLCQIVVLTVAIGSIFFDYGANASAFIALVGVCVSEFFRWKSDGWKSHGEWAKRKLEIAEGLGLGVDSRELTNWIVARAENFLDDIRSEEIQGSEFDSGETTGARRAVENTEESAWWSKHLCQRMLVYLAIVIAFVVVAAILTLAVSMNSLNAAPVKQSGAFVHKVGGIICAVLIFVCSVNLFRLLADYWTFAQESGEILARCVVLLNSNSLTEREACSIMHDYQTARCMAPLIPTFIWKWHGNHLRKHWHSFRQK